MHSRMKNSRGGWRVGIALVVVALAVVVRGQGDTTQPTTMMAPSAAPQPDTPVPTSMGTQTDPPTTSPPVETVPPTVPPMTPPPTATPETTPPTTPPVQTEPPTVLPMTPAPSTSPPVETVPPTVEPTATPMTPSPSTSPPVETDAPTATPVETTPPTVAPTTMPTTEAPAPTVSPTAAPTGPAPTASPTDSPTTAPTKQGATPSPTQAGSTVPPENFPNLSMTMLGMDPLSTASWDVYENTYKDFNMAFYAANPQFGVTDVDIALAFVSQIPPSRRRLSGRQLQNELQVVYNQAITYKITPGSDLTAAEVVQQPFASQSSRDAFVILLRDTNDPAFENLESVSPVTQEQPSSGGDGGLSTGAIIGIAVGGAAGVALLAGGGYYAYKKSHGGGYAKDVDDQPPQSLNLGGGDDVSTLQDPTRDKTMSGTYGDQSVATVDYDYSKAYGGGGDTSVVSSVGGTLGSQTANTAAGAGAVDTSFSDDASFDAHYQDPNANVREVELQVWAPPGKLGVVIDTPNDGAPVVHAIKDSSPIADRLQVGDKLIAVDDDNVETMTAIKVSKLISRKSANSTRKLTIVRTELDNGQQ